MSTIHSLQTQATIQQTCTQTIHNLILQMNERQICLTLEDFSVYHSTSKSSIEKAIQSGMISVQNGGLKDGTDKPKARKLIFKFFNHHTGKIDYPRLDLH